MCASARVHREKHHWGCAPAVPYVFSVSAALRSADIEHRSTSTVPAAAPPPPPAATASVSAPPPAAAAAAPALVAPEPPPPLSAGASSTSRKIEFSFARLTLALTDCVSRRRAEEPTTQGSVHATSTQRSLHWCSWNLPVKRCSVPRMLLFAYVNTPIGTTRMPCSCTHAHTKLWRCLYWWLEGEAEGTGARLRINSGRATATKADVGVWECTFDRSTHGTAVHHADDVIDQVSLMLAVPLRA